MEQIYEPDFELLSVSPRQLTHAFGKKKMTVKEENTMDFEEVKKSVKFHHRMASDIFRQLAQHSDKAKK
jgi:hypothetical protein